MMTGKAFIEILKTRRAIRRYRAGEVSKQILETIVDCGRLAPTANNRQSWEFVVVTDRDKLQKISEIATYGNFIKDAAACIVVCGDPSNRSVYLDGAAATENMLLAIHALGLGSCWVQGYEKDYNQEIKILLGIPEKLVLVSLIPVAHPAAIPPTPPKRPLEDVLHWEKF